MAVNSQIFANAIATRNKVSASQEKEIRRLYKEWANDIEKQIRYYEHHPASSSVVKARQMRELKKSLEEASNQVSNEIYKNVRTNAFIVAASVNECSAKWLAELGIVSPKGLRMTNVEHRVVSSILNGRVYSNGWNLSKALWSDNQKTLKDIHTFLARGIAENKPTYEIAKDIERYINPAKAKPWNKRLKFSSDTPRKGFTFNHRTGKYEKWTKLYKGKVDYNAQRLARTITQHSYQQAFVEGTKDNPFVLKYQWVANGSRPCPLCKSRNGQLYKKDALPLDHPNGMCTIQPVIDDKMNDKLANWLNSPEGTYPEIDEFASSFGRYAPNSKAASTISDNYVNHLNDRVAKQFVEKFGMTPNISSTSVDENDFTGLLSGAYAYVDPKDGSLHINPNIFKDEKTFFETIGGRIRAYHPNATPESILAHEYGHGISLIVDEKKIIENVVAKYVEKYPKSAMDAFIPDYQYAAESISHYAVTTEHELFAEAFGDVYANGDKAQELSKWIVEEVQRRMK